MTALKILAVTTISAAFVLSAPAAGAKPGPRKASAKSRTTTSKTTKSSTRSKLGKPDSPQGLGQRTAGLRYISIPPALFQPMVWHFDGPAPTTATSATFSRAVAPVLLPDGARIREFSCFGQWKPNTNDGQKIRLLLMDHTRTNQSDVIAAAVVGKGDGVRRVDATLDHAVDNFRYAYQLGVIFNQVPTIGSCRVGYEPPAS